MRINFDVSPGIDVVDIRTRTCIPKHANTLFRCGQMWMCTVRPFTIMEAMKMGQVVMQTSKPSSIVIGGWTVGAGEETTTQINVRMEGRSIVTTVITRTFTDVESLGMTIVVLTIAPWTEQSIGFGQRRSIFSTIFL